MTSLDERYGLEGASNLDRRESAAEPFARSSESRTNVGAQERSLSMASGAMLSVLGLKVRGLSGLMMLAGGGAMLYRGYTGHCPISDKLGINTARAANPEDYFDRGIHVESSFTINRPRHELFQFWRDFGNLPRFMKHVEEVRSQDRQITHWKVKAPAGRTVEWDARIVNEVENELIAWQSLDGADVDNSGSVRFLDAPGDRGTEVRVVIDYIPPGGKLGKWVAMLFGEAPELTIKSDLRRFKQLMEAREIPTIEGQSRGSCAC